MAKPKGAKSDINPRGDSFLATLIAIILVSACAGGIGFFSGMQARKLIGSDSSKRAALSAARTSAEDLQVVSLPSIVTNLGGNEGGWIRLEAVVLVKDHKPVPPDLTASLAQDTTALLRTLSVRQISGASGLRHLREELNDRMKVRSLGRVHEVMIQSLVIE